MERNNVLVSVVMCAYNTPHDFISAAIQSILDQTMVQFELLIVDDGSDIPIDISKFSDKRIKLFRNPNNKGISFSRNLAIKKALGKYIAIMDSDDIAEKERLEVELSFMEENPECVACGTWFRQFGEKNNECKRIIDDSNLYKARLLFNNEPTLLDPSCMIRKSVLYDNGILYDESIKCGMDYLMWVKLTEIGQVHNVKRILMNYRTHKNQITKKGFKYYDWEIKRYQLSRLGVVISDTTRDLIMLPLSDKKYSLKDYKEFCDEILAANKKSGYFDEIALKNAVLYQWQRKIIFSKNPIYLLKGFFAIKHEKRMILKCFLRHFGFFRKMDGIVDNAK